MRFATKRTAARQPLPALVVVSLAAFACGCGKNPPSAANYQQLDRLSDREQLIRVSELSDSDIPHLARFRNLRQLDFVATPRRPFRLTPKGFDALAELQLPRLVTLQLGHSDGVNDESLAAVAKVQSLYTIQLFGCNRITGAGIASLASLDHLTELDVLGCEGLTDADLNAF
jgi:hypothetical protein